MATDPQDPEQAKRRKRLPAFPDPMQLARLAMELSPEKCRDKLLREDALWDARAFYDLACEVASASSETGVSLEQLAHRLDEEDARPFLVTFNPDDLNSSSAVRYLEEKHKVTAGWKNKDGSWRSFIESRGTPDDGDKPTTWTIDRRLLDFEVRRRQGADAIRKKEANALKQATAGEKS